VAYDINRGTLRVCFAKNAEIAEKNQRRGGGWRGGEGGKKGMKNGHERVRSRGRLKLIKLKSLSLLAIFLSPLGRLSIDR